MKKISVFPEPINDQFMRDSVMIVSSGWAVKALQSV